MEKNRVKSVTQKIGSAVQMVDCLYGDKITALLDSAGTQGVTYKYNSWGKPLSVSDTTAEKIGSRNPFRYRGYCWDEEIGLYYVMSRYYDSEIGSFVNADSVGMLKLEQGSIQQYNLYVYCLYNPVANVDIEGNIALSVIALKDAEVAVSVAVSATIEAIDAYISNKNVCLFA